MDWRAEADTLPFVPFLEEEAGRLEDPFKEEEVFIALNQLNGDKAPRSMGFLLPFGNLLGPY